MVNLSDKTKIAEMCAAAQAISRQHKSYAALAEDAVLKPIMHSIDTDTESMLIALKSDKILSSVDSADLERDSALRDLGTLIGGYAVIPLPDLREQGKLLKAIFDKYGRGTAEKSNAEETGYIRSMLKDFSADDAKKAQKALLGMSEAVKILSDAQEKFESASDEYMKAVQQKGESATVIKKRLLNTVNNELLPFLKAVQKVPLYADFARGVEAEIAKNNAVVSARAKVSGKTAAK